MNEDSQSEELIHQSDDHSTLSRLLRDAQPGAVIKLEARTYTLNKPLVLHRPVTLAGIGQERTRLLGQGDHPVVVASTNVRVELRDLTLGAWRPGHNQDDGTLVVCSLGRFGMTRCRVYGATGKGRGAGAGVRVERSARFHAEDCVFAGNTGAGVVALESAHVEIRVSAFERNGVGLELEECAVATLKGCTLIEHRSDAVRVAGRARLTAEGNRCEDNRGVGIACLGRAEVRLYRNSCMGSRRDGIIARDQVSGVVQDNSCLHNGGSGVVLLSSGRFEVSSNTLSYNRRHGLRLGDEVKARVRLNACRRNHRTGILSASACAPELLENVCEDNQNHGIVLRGGATGQVRANTCMSNARAGLCLMHRASALVTYNSCAHNRAGILVKGSSSGQIELNTCYGNREHSIKIDAEATPQVRSNTFQGLVEGHVRLEEPTQLPTEVEKWRRVPVRSPRRLDMPLSWGVFSPRLRVAVLATGSIAGVMVVVALLFATPVVSLIALMWLAFGVALVVAERGVCMQRKRLMTYGAWALGEVTGIRRDGSLMLCEWTAADGQRRTFAGVARSASVAAGHHLGEQVAVLYDPAKPDRAVVPSLLGVGFVLPPAADDVRPERPASAGFDLEPLSDQERAIWDLMDAPKPTAHVCWMSWMWSAHRPVAVMGRLIMTSTRLRQLGVSRKATVELDLTRPFAISLSAWLLNGDRAELLVELRQRGAAPDVASLAFKVELSQSQISTRVPLKQSHGPYLDPVRFWRLWSALCFHAKALGEPSWEGWLGEDGIKALPSAKRHP